MSKRMNRYHRLTTPADRMDDALALEWRREGVESRPHPCIQPKLLSVLVEDKNTASGGRLIRLHPTPRPLERAAGEPE